MYYNNTTSLPYRVYDMWSSNTPFPQIDKLLSSSLGSFPTLLTGPVTPPTLHLSESIDKTVEFDSPSLEGSLEGSLEDSVEGSPSTDGSVGKESTKKVKKSAVKKRVHLGACFFPHGCVCGHKVPIRDTVVNSRQRRNPSSVTIQIRTQPVKIGLRGR